MKILIELLYNFGIIVAIAIISGNIGKTKKYAVYYQGIIFGIASLIGMLHPLVISKGLIFDGRSVMISLSGAYFGPIAASISGFMALILRAYQGGIGMPMGVSVIITSTIMGAGFHSYFKIKNLPFGLKNIYTMSFINHVFMIFFMLLLPKENAIFSLKNVAPAVIILYPLFSILIATIINNADNKRLLIKQLKEKEETIRGISSNFQSGMIYQIKFSKGTREFTYLSESVKKLYNCSVDEAKKNPNLIYGKVHIDFIARLMKLEEESIKNLSVFRTEVKILNPDGSYRWSMLVSHPRQEADGTILFDGMEFIINDRKKLEAQLIKEKDDSEKSNRAKTEFLTNMSHELRTPMNGILGLSELLSLTDLNPEQNLLVEDIRSSADNLLLILNDILDISKIESGKLTMEIIDFNIEPLVTDILDLLAYGANKKNLEIIYSIDSGINTFLQSDSGKIRQILINIIGNAIKFSEKGYVYLEIKKIKDDFDSFDLEFSIKDTGIGIKKELLAELISPISREKYIYNKQQNGTGLGLSITQNLLKLLGSKLQIESSVGLGSRFYFHINLKKSKKQNKIVSYSFKNLSVLYIYKIEINKNVTKKILEDAGIVTYVAESSLKAFDILKSSFNIPIVILDINTTYMDDLETARKIKEEFGKEVIVLAPLSNKEILDFLKTLGIADYVIKPIKKNILLETLQKLYNKISSENLYEKNIMKYNPNIKKTIFVVEDNYININLAVKILEKLGNFKILIANNGIEAIEMYKKENPDLIFLDIQMPVMNGFDAFEEIKAIAEEKEIIMPKVIAVSAYDSEKDKDKCLSLGMDEFIAKPFKIENIKDVLDKYL